MNTIIQEPRVSRVANQYYWVANGANPLPAGVQFALDLPWQLVYRRIHLCAYFRNATFANATAAFRFFLKGEEVLKLAIELGEDTGAALAAAGSKGAWVPANARPPFQVTDAATGLTYQDTVATGEGVRFIWRLNGRDISAFCPPTPIVLAADRMTMSWEGPLNVTTAAGDCTVVAAACVQSSNYR